MPGEGKLAFFPGTLANGEIKGAGFSVFFCFGFLRSRLPRLSPSGHLVSPNRIHQESFHHLADGVVVVRGFVIEKPLRLISSATILGMLWRRAANRHFSFGTRSGNFEPRGTMRRSSTRAIWQYTSYMLGLSVAQCWSRPTANIPRTKVMVTAEM